MYNQTSFEATGLVPWSVTSDYQLTSSILRGSQKAGLFAMTGDGPNPQLFSIVARVLDEEKGAGIPVIKPLGDEVILERFNILAQKGVPMAGIDIDAFGFINMIHYGQGVGPKTLDQWKLLVSRSPLPLFVKGIMSQEEGRLAYEAGFQAIVVSNHGGRVLDALPSTAQVLPGIVKSLKGTSMEILVDGGIRTGVDVLRALALGAHGVLISRPLIPGAVGGGEIGVFEVFKEILFQLRLAMIATGTPSVKALDPSLIYANGLLSS